jgi:hypothetical protein
MPAPRRTTPGTAIQLPGESTRLAGSALPQMAILDSNRSWTTDTSRSAHCSKIHYVTPS